MRLSRTLMVLGALLAGGATLFVWASSGTLPDAALTTLTTYDAPPAAPRDTLVVVTYNVGYFSGMTNNRPIDRAPALFDANLDDAATLLRTADADLVALQEIDFGARRSFDVPQLDVLAERLGYAASAAAVNWDEHYVPFPSANPRHHFGRMRSGQAVLSHFPIRQQERHALARPPTPFYYDAFYLDRLAQLVEVDVGQPLVLLNVHLEAWDRATRERQAAEVRRLYLREAARAPVLVLGDFNSPLPRTDADATLGILMDGTGLRDAFADSLYTTAGADLATFPADAPQHKIDHVFYDPAVFTILHAAVLDAPGTPSDHRAVAVRLVFNRPSSANSP